MINGVWTAINKEHGVAISHIILLEPRTIPKTTSGKIARSWCRKAYLGGSFKIVAQKSFEGNDGDNADNENNVNDNDNDNDKQNETRIAIDAEQIRNLTIDEIELKILADVSKLTNLTPSEIPRKAPLTTMMDSMTVAQLKGVLEFEYATELSDEYLFRETCCVDVLLEIVKLGHALDDSGEGGGEGGGAYTWLDRR